MQKSLQCNGNNILGLLDHWYKSVLDNRTARHHSTIVPDELETKNRVINIATQ